MKKEEKTNLTRERILSAAMRAFGEAGYAGVSLNALLSENGISKGLMYHNFSGKEALYLACVDRCFRDLVAFLQAQPARDGLGGYLEYRFRYFTEHPMRARVFFEAMLRPPEGLEEKIRPLRATMADYNRRIYQETLEKLRLRPGVTPRQAMEYFEIIQQSFNGFFSSPAYDGKALGEMIAEHEGKLAKIMDFMLYGIAERQE